MFNKETLTVALKLFIITAVAALCLAAVNMVTTPIIAENTAKAETEAQKEVMADATEFKKFDFSDEDIPNGAAEGVRIESFNIGFADSVCAGYVVTAISNAGYGGDIKVMVGLDRDLRVTRAKILEASETAGLGGNASKPEFIDQYIGKSENISVTKSKTAGENEISAISGATITSRAVTSCVNAAIELVKSNVDGLEKATAEGGVN